MEGDDLQDPVADSARSILDDHIVLDRDLATSNHYPAIDILNSVSRVAPAISSPDLDLQVATVKRLLAAYRDAQVLIEVGAYVPGTNSDVDSGALLPNSMSSCDSRLAKRRHLKNLNSNSLIWLVRHEAEER